MKMQTRHLLASRTLLTTILFIASMMLLGGLGFHLYLAESPIPKNESTIPLRTGPASTEQVVVVVVDGLREDIAFHQELMPNFNRIAQQGASGINITPPMTLTTISVLTMATGKEPGISWALKNFESDTYQDESVMSVLKEAGVPVALVGDAAWTQLFGVHAEHTLSIPDHGFYHGGTGDMAETDAQVFDEALKTIQQKTPDGKPMYPMVVVHVIGSDKTAHKSGAHMFNPDGSRSAYARSCHAIDTVIGTLVDKGNPSATWVIVSDHGVNKWGSHGGGEKEARRAPFAMMGPGVNRATGIEKPMSTLASEWTALLGVRAPRTAWTQAHYPMLDMPTDATTAHRQNHLLTRVQTAKHTLTSTNASHTLQEIEDELHSKPAVAASRADALLKTIHDLWQTNNQERRWARPTGLLFGFALQWLLFWLIGRGCGAVHNAWKATAWCAILWLGFRFSGGWDFRAVEFFGEYAASWRQFGIRTLILTILVGMYTIGIRQRWIPATLPTNVGWILWASFALTMGQSVMVYPYGPLSQMYGVLVILFFAFMLWGLKGHTANRTRCIGAFLCVLAMMFGQHWLFDAHGHRSSETMWSSNVTDVLLVAFLIVLAWTASKADNARAHWPLRIGLLVLAILAVWVHRDAPTWVARTFLFLCPLVMMTLVITKPNPYIARNATMALGIILYRALGSDPRFMMLLLLAVVVILLSAIHEQKRSLSVPFSAAFALLLQHAYFHWVGHSYSFSDIDVDVVFTATKDAINLGEGFALILLQHLGPWLVIIGGLVYYFAKQSNQKALIGLSLALPGAYLIQGFAAFGSFEYQLDNYWFTLHALPLFIFAMCNVLLIGVATSLAMTMYPEKR